MLNVDRGDDGNACVEKVENVLVTFAILRAWDVGVGQFIDNHDSGVTMNDSVTVHLFQSDAAIFAVAQWQALKIADHCLRIFASMSLDGRNDDIDALLLEQLCVCQHLKSLTNASGRTDVHAHPALLAIFQFGEK